MDAEFESLLEEYWNLAFDEGKRNRSNGTAAGEVLHKIREAWNRRASPASAPEGWKIPAPMEHEPLRADEPMQVQVDMYHYVKGWNACREHGIVLAAAPTPPVSEDRKDAERLDYLQKRGAAVQLILLMNGIFGFEVGGLHKTRKQSLRDAIDAAIQETKP